MRTAKRVKRASADQLADFSFLAAGSIGTDGIDTFRGPGFFINASLVKRFEVMERKYLTFRAEAYNLTNYVDLAAPSMTLGGTASSFGKITGTYNNPRIFQLALRPGIAGARVTIWKWQ